MILPLNKLYIYTLDTSSIALHTQYVQSSMWLRVLWNNLFLHCENVLLLWLIKRLLAYSGAGNDWAGELE